MYGIQAMTTLLPGHKPPHRVPCGQHAPGTLQSFSMGNCGWWKRGQRGFKLLELYRRQCMVRDAGAIANETSRSGMGWAVMGNRLYISGGYIGNNTYKDDVKKYGP